ncbi:MULTISPECIES: carbohydrate ABC transporter permease [unclassified Chelatococcus]|uniref:carbohydrate ABC transporter permease n=1 Tax=unclassified Chelatococcus TaxID=2638111 RepID=UPI001BD11B2C|nr:MULTISPECIES: carbohydrate ABC transporter permease [unclassified Chelatococcus]MBS7700486.1 carbohydrate ABC transporter permease [Chelatococcus sp. YT9]MBX3556282.1 carbohydrate ABC transporter permease [Chelatococcus sp.]
MNRRTLVLLSLLSLIAVATTLFPILWMVNLSLKTQVQALQMPPEFFFMPTFAAYRAAWSKAGFGPALFNSLVVSALALSVGLILGLLAAYAVSRFRFVGAQTVLFAMLVTRIFPPVALILPFYLNLRTIGGHDTYWGLALAYVALNVPLATWMLKGYFDAIPRELEECAMIDGASRFTAVRKITLPLMAPGIVATSIFAFIVSWNDFLFALILTSRNARTLPVVIAEFVGDTGVDWPEVMAASVTALAPILAATFILQKHIAQGLVAGAVKG